MPTIEESAERLAALMQRSTSDAPNRDISLDLVAEYAAAELPGVTCYVEQTGGGCATIYVGDSYDAREDEVTTFPPERPFGELRPVMAGPGWFMEPGWQCGRADPDEFSMGYDANDPNPAIANVIVDGWGLDPVEEFAIARRLVLLYRAHPRVVDGTVR